MPLFKCDTCGALENTALSNYWFAKTEGQAVEWSECDSGTWHGQFPKETPEEAGYVLRPDGFYDREKR